MKTKSKGFPNSDFIPRVPRELTLVEIPLAAEQAAGLRVMGH
jgi:hypothetical protein